jgi:hypothetical protein
MLQQRVTVAQLGVLAVILSLIMWWPLHKAEWGLIDDHEIMMMIGQPEHLAWHGIPEALSKTELAPEATLPRFRPTYYFARTLEAVVWGKDASKWYSFRIAIAVFFSVALAAVLVRISPTRFAAVALLLMLGGAYWADIFARAGPAETYAVLGFACALLAMRRLMPGDGQELRISLGRACVLAFGLGCMIGSKENFAIFALFPLWLMIQRRIHVTFWAKIILTLPVIFTIWIVGITVSRLSVNMADVYMRSMTLSDRAGISIGFFSLPVVWLWGATLLSVACLLPGGKEHDLAQEERRQVKQVLLLNLIFFGLFFSQYIFYAGEWPAKAPGRYLFPGILLAQIAIFWLYAVLRPIEKKLVTVKWGKIPAWLCVITFFACFLVAPKPKVPVVANLKSSLKTVSTTNRFAQQFSRLANYLQQNPDSALIISSYSVSDYEPIHALLQFVRSKGLANPVALRLVGYASHEFPASSLKNQLATKLEAIMLHGEKSFGFTDLGSVDMHDCFSVGLHGQDDKQCREGVEL